VLLAASDRAWAEAIDALLGGHAVSAGPRADCEIRVGAEPPPLPTRPPDEALADLDVWYGDELALRHRSGLAAVVGRDLARVGGETDDLRQPFRRLFLPIATALLARRDRFVLHAAAVVGANGAALALGGTGAGKSTLALAALEGGWRVLADDLVVVAPSAPDGAGVGPCVAGIRRPIAVPDDVLPPGFDGASSVIGDARRRVELAPEHLDAAWEPVHALLLVTRGATSGATATRVTNPELLGAVLDAFAAVRHPDLLRRFVPHAAALSRLDGWRFEHSGDPGNRLAEAARVLGAVAPTAPSDPG
jgi:hypothetical protein